MRLLPFMNTIIHQYSIFTELFSSRLNLDICCITIANHKYCQSTNYTEVSIIKTLSHFTILTTYQNQ